MKFYETRSETGVTQLVGTQAEIPKGQPLKAVEVPTDKDGLKDFVNNLYQLASDVEEVTAVPAPVAAPEKPKSIYVAEVPKVATREAVEEFILEADSYVLSNVFAVVMERFDRLRREILNA